MGMPTLHATADDIAFLADRKPDNSLVGRILIERAIVRRACQCLIEAGYTLRLNDGEGWSSPKESSVEQVMQALMATDEEHLHVFHTTNDVRKAFGWVQFVYGNDGWDVIANNTVNIEEVLKPVEAFATTLESGAIIISSVELWQPTTGLTLDADGWCLYRSKADREAVAIVINEQVAKILSAPLEDGDEPLDAIFHVLESYSAYGANDTEGRDVARKLVAERFGPSHAGAALEAAKRFAAGFEGTELEPQWLNDPRRFTAVWGEGYDPKTEEVTMEFFCDSMGYTAEHIAKINALGVGAEADLSEMGNVHTITRKV